MAKRAKQLEFHSLQRPSDSFGGDLLKSHPKTKRPLDSKYPILATLRSNQSLMRKPQHFHKVNDIVRDAARKYGIKIYDFVNMGNHLHLVFKLHHKRFWTPFIREITSRIVQLFKDVSKPISALSKAKDKLRFWRHRPHTRIIRSWKQGFKNALEYIELNKAEASGHIRRAQTKTLKEYRAIFELAPISMKDPPVRV